MRLFFLVKYDDVANTSNIIDAFAKKKKEKRKLCRIVPVFAQFLPSIPLSVFSSVACVDSKTV